jgi:hypothetical protein
MPSFRFDDSKTFDENWAVFVIEAQAINMEMAAILAANKDKLAAIVRQGQSNGAARASFNAEVVKALDALLAKPAGGGGST